MMMQRKPSALFGKAERKQAITRKSQAFPIKGKPDQLKPSIKDGAEDRQEALIDEGVEETFPASDPVSVKRIT